MLFKDFDLRGVLVILLCLVSNFLFSQTDMDYEARSSAYNFCSCVNNVFPDIGEEIIDLYIESHTLNKFELKKKLSLKNKTFRTEYEKTILIFNDEIKLTKLNKCLKEVKNDIHNFDINIIDSSDSQEIFKTKLLKYLSFNFDCKLTIFLFNKKP